MALKLLVKSLDEVPEALHEFYEETESGYALQADDVTAHPSVTALKNALDKEKQDRRKARDEAKALKEKFADLDADEAREALKRLQDLQDKDLIEEGKLDELLQQRTERMRAEFDKDKDRLAARIAELEGESKGLNGRLSELLIDNALRSAATGARVRDTAIDDVLLRGKQLWKLKDGHPVPMNGEDVVYGKDPTKPLTMEEWLGGLQDSAPHLFEESKGGGAGGSGEADMKGRAVDLSQPNAVGKNLEGFARGDLRGFA